MKRKPAIALLLAAVLFLLLAGCGGSSGAPAPAAAETPAPAATEAPAVPAETEAPAAPEAPAVNAAGLSDGTYRAKFDTDSSMFHVNEASKGRGILTVEKGEMTIHISMPSKNIVNLFPGSAEDAQKEGAALLQPTVDTVDYGDGSAPEEVYGFDVPVPCLDEEFPCAILGSKGKWYDHAVSVSDPIPAE